MAALANAQAAREHKATLQALLTAPPVTTSSDGKTATWRKATNAEMHQQWGTWEDRPE